MNLDRYAQFLSKLKIRDRDSGRLVPFIFNRNQQITLEKLKVQRSKGLPLRWITLKSRRVGMSSFTDGLAFCYVMEKAAIEARIVAHLDDTVEMIFGIPTSLAKSWNGRFPSQRIDITKERITVPHTEAPATLSISTAGSTSGGRGGGFHFLHVSEAGYFKSSDSFTSLLNTVPDHPDTVVSIESTANGKVGLGLEFYRRWNAAVRGDSEYIPVFLSWLDDPGCVRNPKEIEGRELDGEEKDLIKYFNATPAQLAWRRYVLIDRCNGYVERLHQEFPVTPEEAFISSGNPAFTTEEMTAARASVNQPAVGQLMVENGSVIFREGRGILKLWGKPKDGHTYYIGVDAARGLEAGDFASITVLDGTENEVVARYDCRISPRPLAKVVRDLAKWYLNALVIIELTGNLGIECQNELRDVLGYRKLYRRKGRDDKAGQTKAANLVGWETNHRTRDQLLISFRESLRDGGLLVRDETVVSQMGEAQQYAVDGFEVKHGHDDSLFSMMLANIACRQYPPPRISGFKSPHADQKDREPMPRAKTVGDTVATTLMQQGNEHIRKIYQFGKDARAEALAKARLEGL